MDGPAQEAGQRSRVFVVDDDVHFLELMMRMLRGEFELESFSDPSAALARAQEVPPALVVTDYRMPGMTGLGLVAALRERGVRCRAILVTAFADAEEVRRALEAGLVDLTLAKPFPGATLRQEVARCLAARAADPQTVERT